MTRPRFALRDPPRADRPGQQSWSPPPLHAPPALAIWDRFIRQAAAAGKGEG